MTAGRDGENGGEQPAGSRGFSAKSPSKTRAPQGWPELSTGNGLCLESWSREGEQNTTYSGLLLTCATDSGTLSSAAINGLQ
jgi:hypothetical protein